jgi:2-polyprenyl-6-methoxyphenol hydroxylase-like FAD-dependent oxidoreductase
MANAGEQAVVIGASVGGLLTARVLSEFYERVTIVERDVLPASGETRKGVPQARHAHGILVKGTEALEALFPGLRRALVAAGGLPGDVALDGSWTHGGRRHLRHESGLHGLLVSRPRLEGELLARVRAIANVRIVERTDVLGLVFTERGARATGVRVIARAPGAAEELLPADLTVDASGRGSRVPAWLAAAGRPAPSVDKVAVDIRYTTRVYRRHAAELGGALFAIVSAAPDVPRAGVALAMEGDRWIVTAAGYLGDEPPEDPGAFAAWLGTLADPVLEALVRGAEPLPGNAVHHRMPASVRRRYERLKGFPAGLLVLGDALCSFNPVYGQGMTVAALEALALRDLLARGPRRLAQRFFRRAARIVEMAWSTAVVNDLGLASVPGRRTAGTRFLSWYLARLHAAAERDAVVSGAFLRVANLCAAPATILRPAVAWRVLGAPLGWTRQTSAVEAARAAGHARAA